MSKSERQAPEIFANAQAAQQSGGPSPERYKELYERLDQQLHTGYSPETLTARLDKAAAQLGWDNLAEFFVSQTLQALSRDFHRTARNAGEPGSARQDWLLDGLDNRGQQWKLDDDLGPLARQQRAQYVSFVKQLAAYWKREGRI